MDAYGCVVYLRRITRDFAETAFVFEKSRIVLLCQQNWAIARKELVAAVMSAELLDTAAKALKLPHVTRRAG